MNQLLMEWATPRTGEETNSEVASPDAMTPPLRWLWALTLAAGVALRVGAFLDVRSLWLDEAMVAWNICARPLAGLLRPLDYDQAAPVGFLALERLMVVAFGPREWALRLVPFLASLGVLALVDRYGRAYLGARGRVAGVALAAVAPALIYYSGEAKQYALDLVIGLAIPVLAAPAVRGGLSPRRAVALAIVGAVAVWFSHPAVFVLAGAGTTLLAVEIRRRRLVAGLGVCLAWGISFVVSYVAIVRHLNSDRFLAQFWRDAFLPFPPASPGAVRQYVVVFLDVFETIFHDPRMPPQLGERMAVLAAVVWLVGIVALRRAGQRGLLALLVLPLGFGAIAAMLHAYPLRYRMTLFAAGPCLLLMATAIAAALRAPDGLTRTIGRVFLIGLGLLPALQAAQGARERARPYGARPVLERVAQAWRPGDALLVDRTSEPPFRFYREFGRVPGLDRVAWTRVRARLRDPAQAAVEAARWRGRRRVWLLCSDHLDFRPDDPEDRFLTLTLDRFGRRLDAIAAPGYYAYLYDFGTEEPSPARPSADTNHQ